MDSGTLKNIVKNHYYKLNLGNDPESDSIIDMQIRAACSEVAQETVWECLLEEVVGNLTTSSTFIINELCMPHMVFMYGTEDSPNWRRVLCTDFDFGYSLQQQGNFNYNISGYRRRYMVNKLHPVKTETQLKLVNFTTSPESTIRVLYYPLLPAVAQFTENFIPYILNKVIRNTLLFFREKSPMFNYQLLEKQMEDQLFALRKTENKIELHRQKRIKTRNEIEFINQGYSDLLFYGNYGSGQY